MVQALGAHAGEEGGEERQVSNAAAKTIQVANSTISFRAFFPSEHSSTPLNMSVLSA